MLSRLREHLGSAGLIVAIVALVAALGGGAYAASGGSGGGKATASAKGKQGPRGKTGKTGPAGPAGPAGPQGPAGPAGAKGDTGAAGSNGTNGTDGSDGVSVASEEFTGTKDGKCAGRGGSKFVAANGNTYACNGKEGSPWTAGGTLPPEETETGTWAFGPVEAPQLPFNEPTRMPLSFPIPLEAPLSGSQVHFINAAGKETIGVAEDPETEQLEVTEQLQPACPGSAAAPAADPGHLCVYAAAVLSTGFPGGAGPAAAVLGAAFNPALAEGFAKGAATTGADLGISLVKKGAKGWGTWAVTAPAE